MPPYGDGREYGEDNYIAGAHGTIAEQQDEAFYDDRSDASDDMEKGRLKFPTKMYGRERELEIFRKLYDGLAEWDTAEENKELRSTPDPFVGSRVVFLSGYSGIGKSALVGEFIKQTQRKYGSSKQRSQILYASGKYTEQSTSSAPFSAIIEVLEKLSSDLSKFPAPDLSRRGKREKEAHTLRSKVLSKIKESELIGPGTEGNSVLRATFTKLNLLLGSSDEKPKKKKDLPRSSVHHSLNAIKESTAELLSVICGCLEHPMVIFLDDLQWADEASINILSLLLTSKKLSNIMFICAYRSNEVDADHSFSKLMDGVKKARNVGEGGEASTSGTVESMDLFSLSPEAIKNFIADSVNKEDDEGEGVAELAEAVYTKTMGNIFFVKQALEELVRKNILFYDIMCFEWRWVVSKVDLGNYMSDAVVETVKGKIKELSSEIQHMLIVMAYLPNSIDVPILKALMNYGEFIFKESIVGDLLKEASEEGMVLYSNESENYVFAHDRIRQASLEFGKESGQDELVVHISQVMLKFGDQGLGMEWCLYVAVDLLNSLPPDPSKFMDLLKLNVRVAKQARKRGSLEKENELLRKGLKLLESSGKLWKEYALTLEMYYSVIKSDYTVGSRDMANFAISNVIKYAKTNNEKVLPYLYQMLCKCDETSDYSQAAVEGVKILNLAGFNIPTKITKPYMMKEEMKLKMALQHRSYSCLTQLPIIEDDPMFCVFLQVLKVSAYSNNKLTKVVAWKAICYALKRGISKNFPVVMVWFAAGLGKQGNVKTSNELGNVAVALSKRFPEDSEISAITQIVAYSVMLLQPYQSGLEPYLQSHKVLKLFGADADLALGSMLCYFEHFMASGVQYGPLVESKLLLVEDYTRSIDRLGFLTIFLLHRQFSLNLRTRSNNPTEFCGKAFHEEEALSEMSDSARKMALRDSSSMRLQLSFVFGDEEGMVQMLRRLQGMGDYPFEDMIPARLHNRLCFVGLAAYALGKSKENESFWNLGKHCLSYFANLTKLGSVNAKPVYKFMLAMKRPSSESFNKAIEACSEAGMIHLEAMARERCAKFLFGVNNEVLAKDHLTVSYWLYQEWGAHAKALQMSQQYDFLKKCKRNSAKSTTLSATVRSTVSSDVLTPSYSFNTTLKSRSRILVKQ